MDPVSLVVAVATIAALVLNAVALRVGGRQLSLQATALRLQTDALEEERFERMRQRELRRDALFAALKAELREIQITAEEDHTEYQGMQPQMDRIGREGDSRTLEGETRHKLGFPWSPMSDHAISQAISEAALLGLKPDRTEKLRTLRRKIQRVNALVPYKVGVYPELIHSNVSKVVTAAQFYGAQTWAVE